MRNQTPPTGAIISSTALKRLTATRPDDAASYVEPPALLSRSVIEGFYRAVEVVLVGALGGLFWYIFERTYSAEEILYFITLAGFVTPSIPLACQLTGLYQTALLMNFTRAAPRLIIIWASVFAVAFAVVFFTKLGTSFSRLWLGFWAVGGLAFSLALRATTSSFLHAINKKGHLNRRAVLVGGGDPARDLLKAFDASPASDVSIIGIFDDRGDDRSPARIGNLRKLGGTADLVGFARETRVDMLIVTLPLVAENRLLEVLKSLWILPVDIRLSAYSQKLRYKSRAYSYVGNIPMLDVFDKPLSGWNSLLKELEDKIIAVIALVVLSPLMALVALAVKLDSPGPVLFRQKRYGFNNEMIEVFKFRSMYADKCDATATKLVTRNDNRVTRVGRFIRKTSLDELPQVFNVLRGELSLVGPRPHATHAKAQDRLYSDVVDGYFARHRVKPGVTGWAQINGWRGETDTQEKIERRVEHDLYYIENWSLLFDVYILARTPFALVETENAY